MVIEICLVFSISNLGFYAFASPPVRIKDLAHVLGARENQLMGFGLVVGLYNTGDSQQTGFTKQAMTNLLSKMGVTPQIDFKSRNVAAVMVTASLPPYVKSGQQVDVTVASMGDASSLVGGTLLITPLQGSDGDVYAVAQGNVSTNQDLLIPNLSPFRSSRSTSGRIPGGALVEKEVPVSIADKGALSIVLNDPDFTTASRVASVIAKAGFDARATDAGTVKVTVFGDEDALKMMAKVENLTVVPDMVARVVINERTGTIVIGEDVTLAPAAVSYGSVNVTIGMASMYADEDTTRTQTNANFNRKEQTLRYVPQATKLSDLVKALNGVKANSQELIAILQAMKRAGSLKADLEII